MKKANRYDIIKYIGRRGDFMPTKKEDTSRRISQRRYEEKNKEERKKTSGNFQAMMPRDKYDEINIFLQENNITKVQLVIEGYEAMKARLNKKG